MIYFLKVCILKSQILLRIFIFCGQCILLSVLVLVIKKMKTIYEEFVYNQQISRIILKVQEIIDCKLITSRAANLSIRKLRPQFFWQMAIFCILTIFFALFNDLKIFLCIFNGFSTHHRDWLVYYFKNLIKKKKCLKTFCTSIMKIYIFSGFYWIISN